MHHVDLLLGCLCLTGCGQLLDLDAFVETGTAGSATTTATTGSNTGAGGIAGAGGDAGVGGSAAGSGGSGGEPAGGGGVPSVACGVGSCPIGASCCQPIDGGDDVPRCESPFAACNDKHAAMACDSRDDCAAEEVCCNRPEGPGSVCAGVCLPTMVVCTTNEDCLLAFFCEGANPNPNDASEYGLCRSPL